MIANGPLVSEIVMYQRYSCFRDIHVSEIFMYQRYSCIRDIHVSEIFMFQRYSCIRDIHVSEIFMFQRYSCFMFESVKRHTDRRTQAHTDAGSSPNLYAHLVSHQLR